jgi:folate-dependent phosphoribosylglycinamide formyltransferase PurN
VWPGARHRHDPTLRVAVITGEELHHKHLCVSLNEAHDLVGVIHPRRRTLSVSERLRKGTREMRKAGIAPTVNRALNTHAIVGWDLRSDMQRAELAFKDAGAQYDEIDDSIKHNVSDVNSTDGLELVHSFNAEVVVCLGGPIYRQPLIDACHLMLNIHTGVSPLYNGASSISFAFANGHPHLCGATIMVMNTTVDGGDMLAHYLPLLESGDTPGTIFMKTVRGGVEGVVALLDHLAEGKKIARCRQPPPLFYYRSKDWTVETARRTKRHVQGDAAARHARQPRTVAYWAADHDDEARQQLGDTVLDLLGVDACA